MTPYGRCPYCGKVVAARFPKGGDGTAVILRRHRDSCKDDCAGTDSLVDEVQKP